MSGNYDDGRPRWPEREFERDYERERNRYLERDRYPDSAPPPVPEPPTAPEPEPQPEPEPPTAPEPEPEPPTAPEAQQAPSEGEAHLQSPPTESSEPTTQFADWDLRRDGDRRRPTTAEQAVPWLIGLLLALTGIVVVLLALIFIGPEGVASLPSPSATPSVLPSPSATPISSPTPVPTPAPTAIPAPVFGALEMTFLGRATASAPIRLLRRDFSTTTDPAVVAEDPAGVEDYAWAPDGRVGAAIISRRAVALVVGQPPRPLTDPVDALVFADDSTTLYGLRITPDGSNDRAELVTIEFATGATKIVTTITYPHPAIVSDPALKEAQFADNGGIVRLTVTTDGFVVAWVLGAPAAYRIDPANGTFTPVGQQPVMWSPDQRMRIDVTEKSGTTTLVLLDVGGIAQSAIAVTGLVSHVRWAGTNNEIVFTLGRLVGGGVRQDLYVWDLVNGKAPSPLTSNGASFGAEWLGVLQSWKP